MEDHHCEARFFRNSTPKGPKPGWQPLRSAAGLSCCGVPLRKCLLRQRSTSASRSSARSGPVRCCGPSVEPAHPESQHRRAPRQARAAPAERMFSGAGNSAPQAGSPVSNLAAHRTPGRKRGGNERAPGRAPGSAPSLWQQLPWAYPGLRLRFTNLGNFPCSVSSTHISFTTGLVTTQFFRVARATKMLFQTARVLRLSVLSPREMAPHF